MPTGYTADVVDGKITELEPFIWQLARGMGALIMMRDAPHDAPIPEAFEPSDYNTRQLAELSTERDRLYAMSDADASAAALAEVVEYDAAKEAARAKRNEERERYTAMIAKVEAWQNAPEGIREFALEQLRTGLDFDCPAEFKYWRERPTANGAEWRRAKLDKIAKDRLHHVAEQAKENERTAGRNAWLEQLRRSLAGATRP